jgi:hypothetical protein
VLKANDTRLIDYQRRDGVVPARVEDSVIFCELTVWPGNQRERYLQCIPRPLHILTAADAADRNDLSTERADFFNMLLQLT